MVTLGNRAARLFTHQVLRFYAARFRRRTQPMNPNPKRAAPKIASEAGSGTFAGPAAKSIW